MSAICSPNTPAEQAITPGRPYYLYGDYLKARFGCRVYKLTLDAGFTCPNRDGTKGKGGCTFCDQTGSSSRAQDRRDTITDQLLGNLEKQRRRFKAEKFIAYFQSFTNTYAPTDRLKALYDEAMAAHPDIIGLAVSTRPDCVDEEKIALLASYQEGLNPTERYVSVEYGLQTIHNQTLEAINRCETYEDFERAYDLTKQYKLNHCIHVILGLPGEGHAEMMATAERLAELKVEGVKLHLLCAMEHTPIAHAYQRGEWQPMEQDEYIETICDFIERLHPDCVLHRISGNGHHQHVVAPVWLQKKLEMMTLVENEFARRGTRQGSQYRDG